MYTENADTANLWVTAINRYIKEGKEDLSTGIIGDPIEYSRIIVDPVEKPPENKRQAKIEAAKKSILFLQQERAPVLEFLDIWTESVPTDAELANSSVSIDYQISVSANMNKLSWRASGPQHVIVQKMVDFFWNVGAPENEIDFLNTIGGVINPPNIGSWIDMSARGGMDGGWFFPVETAVSVALTAADAGKPLESILDWTRKHKIDFFQAVGRDMGATPPRQAEFKMNIPGDNFAERLDIALDAFSCFEFPELPERSLAVLKRFPNTTCISLSIVVTHHAFVRIGILFPKPPKEIVKKICSSNGSTYENINEFEIALSSDGPLFLGYQFLRTDYGYSVYKEGFDVIFHYEVTC